MLAERARGASRPGAAQGHAHAESPGRRRPDQYGFC